MRATSDVAHGRRPLLVLLLSVVTALLLAVVVLGFRSTPHRNSQWFARAFSRCVTSELATASSDPETTACLREVLVAAVANGDVVAARAALAEVVRSEPRMHNSCHLAEHEAATTAVTDTSKVAGMLRENFENVCSWGFGHGALEAFGSRHPSPADWLDVYQTCSAMQEAGTRALCADGLGHAAWNDKEQLPAAVAICESFLDETTVSECTGGVLMQMFQPAVRDVPLPDLPDLSGFCTSAWPGRARASRQGCAFGVGYVLLTGKVAAGIDNFLRQAGRDASAQLGAAQATLPLLRDAIDVCATQGEWADTCTSALLSHLPREDLSAPVALDALCQVFPGRWREQCA